MRSSMVVNARFGQLSNRLILTAHCMASAIENGLDVRLTEFDDLAPNYKCNVSWDGSVTIRKSAFWQAERMVYTILRKFMPKKAGSLDKIEQAQKPKRVITSWDYRDYFAVEKHADQIRAFFMPNESLIKTVEQEWKEEIVPGADVIIGVHIRRGDYINWNGGKYFYDDSVYIRVMKELEEDTDKRCKFVVFSNEEIDVNAMRRELQSEVVCSKGSAVEDHYKMSNCNFLVGPPSTFSRWGGGTWDMCL